MGFGSIGGNGNGGDGIPGADGKSAYQIALENGFVGTEEDWLDSLNGKDGEIRFVTFDLNTETGLLTQYLSDESDLAEFKINENSGMLEVSVK